MSSSSKDYSALSDLCLTISRRLVQKVALTALPSSRFMDFSALEYIIFMLAHLFSQHLLTEVNLDLLTGDIDPMFAPTHIHGLWPHTHWRSASLAPRIHRINRP